MGGWYPVTIGNKAEAERAEGSEDGRLRPISDQRLETERLRLRRLEPSDAPAVARLMSDWEVAKQTISIPLPYTEANAVHWIKRTAKGWRKDQNYCLAIENKEDSVLIGALSLRRKGFFARKIGVLGYWLGRDYWGMGLAGEAVEALLSVGVESLDLRRVEARVFADNLASKRVLEKNGLRIRSVEMVNLADRGGRREIHFYRARF